MDSHPKNVRSSVDEMFTRHRAAIDLSNNLFQLITKVSASSPELARDLKVALELVRLGIRSQYKPQFKRRRRQKTKERLRDMRYRRRHKADIQRYRKRYYQRRHRQLDRRKKQRHYKRIGY